MTGLRRSLVVVRAEVRTRDVYVTFCASPKVSCMHMCCMQMCWEADRKLNRLLASGAVTLTVVPARLID